MHADKHKSHLRSVALIGGLKSVGLAAEALHDKMKPRTMERASKLIRGLRLPGDTISSEELACAAWANAVGKRIAAHTRAARLVRTKLVVEVEDRIWQRQLFTLSGHILANLTKA